MNPSIVNMAVQRFIGGRDMPAGEYDVPLTGVPGMSRARIQIAHTDVEQRVVVTHVDGEPLEALNVIRMAASFSLQVGDIAWHRPTQLIDHEVIAEDDGQDVTVRVNTDGKWYMTCACGRRRYATKNNLKRVKACHVCAKQHARARKTKWQRQRRSS